MATIDFKDRKDLERWLKSRPREDAIVLAARAALRVAPLLSWPGEIATRFGSERWRADILLPSLRGMASPWLAAKVPSHGDERLAAASAAFSAARSASAASASASSVRSASAAFSAARSASAASASASSVRSASASASASAASASASSARSASASAAAWKAITLDARALAGVDGVAKISPATLAVAPLWSRVEWPIGAPDWVGPASTDFVNYLFDLQRNHPDEHWDVWLTWWRARYNGGNAFGLSDAAAERVETGIVLLPEEIWKQGPKVVNPAIKQLIEEARAGQQGSALDRFRSPYEFSLTAKGTITATLSSLNLPAFPFANGQPQHKQRLEAVQHAAQRVQKAIQSRKFQVRDTYGECLSHYCDKLPKGIDDGNILICDGEARTMLGLWASEKDIYPQSSLPCSRLGIKLILHCGPIILR